METIVRSLNIWQRQIRAPFLLLSISLVGIGYADAYYHGQKNLCETLLLLIGVIACHIAVNLFNELHDHKTGIDHNTKRTPFSGGSGMLQQGLTSPRQVKIAAYCALAIAGAIGSYFMATRGWLLLPIILVGFIAIRFYTSHLAKWLLGELVSGLTLGSLVIIGSYYVLTQDFDSSIILAAIPSGLLTLLLLLFNEIPDIEADKKGGRLHLAILLGRENSLVLYTAILLFTYILIGALPFLTDIPKTTLIALASLPIGILAIRRATYSLGQDSYSQAQGLNVTVVLLTNALLATGYLVSGLHLASPFLY